MAGFPCPYCGHALASNPDEALDRCPRCGAGLQIAYRYRLAESHGQLGGGLVYRAVDDGFGQSVAVVFVTNPDDSAAVERFLEGHRLFADLGGCGLARIEEVGSARDPRPYVVMDWLTGGTLAQRVAARGALDQATLLELVSDLLTGLSKAHRSMPAIAHGQIHPNMVGFRKTDEAVLFGFGRARQVNAQASRLAYSFTAAPDDADDEGAGLVGDLRALALVFHYAATGEWLAEWTLAQQRERVRTELPGPLGRLVDRLLGAGADGYRSAVEAAMDFEALRSGSDSWQGPRTIAQSRVEVPMGTAFGGAASAIAGVDLDGDGQPDWADDDEEDDEEHVAEHQPTAQRWPDPSPSVAPAPAGRPAPQTAPPAVHAALARAKAQALAQEQAQASKPAAGRRVFFAVVLFGMIGTCVSGLLEDLAPDLEQPPPTFERRVEVEPIPAEPYLPPELAPLPAEQPTPSPAGGLAGTFKYTANVSGPPDVAGLALGDRCEVWVTPADAGGELDCRWWIDCGEPRRRVYGGGDSGYSSCVVDERGWPQRAQDQDDDAPDGAFFADLTGEQPMVILLDRWLQPPVNAILAIEGGALVTDAVPDTPIAARVERAEIERRIAAGDYPPLQP